ncbi:MAG TPA: DUF3617 family protein [Xanthobacteraceae bacterium]|nr:DUF3617 family protein [Xanthobacteraceae bacterium]
MRLLLPAILVSLAAATPASALDLPTRKAGLWEINMSFEGRNLPAQAIQQCVDAATDKLMNSIGGSMGQAACSKQDVQKVGATMVVDSICKIGPMTMTSNAVVSGDFNSAYTVKVSSKTDGTAMPGVPAGRTSNTTIEAKWAGPCKPDQKPGDIIMGNGQKMNIRDLQNLPGMPGQKR